MEENKDLIFKRELKYLVESFGKKNQDGVKEALRLSQELFGYVSKSHQKQIIESFSIDEKILKVLIKINPSLRESMIEYDIICCTGSRCSKNNSFEIIKEIRDELNIDFNETTNDGRIRLRTQNCFKECNLGPNIMINGEIYNFMDKEKTKKLLREIKQV